MKLSKLFKIPKLQQPKKKVTPKSTPKTTKAPPKPAKNDHIIDLNSKAPRGFSKRLAEDVPVVGVSHRTQNVIEFIDGMDKCILLKREQAGPKKEQAIAVYGSWLKRLDGDRLEAHLGYLSREMLAALGDQLVAGTLRTIYKPTKDTGPGLRIDIWTN